MIAGGFLIASLLLAVFIASVLSQVSDEFGSFEEYNARFLLSDGVPGLQPESPVLLGGLPVGQVRAITPVTRSVNGAEVVFAHDVRFRMRSEYRIFENARVNLEQPLLGQLSTLNIRDAGDAALAADRAALFGLPAVQGGGLLDPGETVPGDISPAFLAAAGISQDQMDLVFTAIDETRPTIENIGNLAGEATEIARSLRPSFEPGGDFTVALANVRQVSDDLRERVGALSDQVSEILTRAEPLLENMDGAVTDARSTIGTVQSGVEDSRRLIAEAQVLMERNSPKIDRTLDNIEAASSTVNSELMPQVSSLLERGSSAMTSAEGTISQLESIIAEQRPAISETVSNMRMASEDATLFVQEVKAAPWRLLNRPEEKELERQLFYDATRAFATAAADVRAASDALEAVLGYARATNRPVDEETVGLIRDRLERAFAQYERAEREMLDQLSRSGE